MKSLKQHRGWQLAALIVTACVATVHAYAQANRITAPVDNTKRFTLAGHISPRAVPKTIKDEWRPRWCSRTLR